ncbi:WecB/TagA/CpsF family glycosyltransferase [Flavivirga spongiicola]|uniref:WecB/TagA/CpsF family glycosyltransferase n=1 Tax=Flavivirga spongiicola TaxID=421621 RepID=A0ABU7XTT6_9FLAO|nr:WecB/TagA/CpsF family glycosyltransferase [Flavivirga sp. MEBiC05379]MDO5978839.1 WecB/TagA/CpsF family glycosyltransferase [Flavivirga sp. MEBiC05379]
MSSFFSNFTKKVYPHFTSEVNFKEIFESSGHLYTFVNPYSYLILRKKDNLINNVDFILIDGILLVKVLKFLGIKTQRVSFDMTSLAPKLFEFCEENTKTIYFVGTKQSDLEKSIVNIKKEFANLNIIGYRNGYFNDFKEKELFQEELISLNPDYIIVGMGTPLQEEFIIELKSKGYKGKSFTCGGFLHQSSSNMIYYPAWVDKLELRWLYRSFNEKGVFKRVLISSSLFLVIILFDFFNHYFSKRIN